MRIIPSMTPFYLSPEPHGGPAGGGFPPAPAGRGEGRFLGLDAGRRRVGVAISDHLLLTAQPLTTLERGQGKGDIYARIKQLCEEKDIYRIVVGMPYGLDGTPGPQAEAVAGFMRRLRETVPVPGGVVPWDERLSTAAAERTLLEADLSRARRRRVRDQLAAAFILQAYLDSIRKE